MYRNQEMCSFSSGLTLQKIPGPPELKHSEPHLLKERSRSFPPNRETEPKKPQDVDRPWDGLPLRHGPLCYHQQVLPPSVRGVSCMSRRMNGVCALAALLSNHM